MKAHRLIAAFGLTFAVAAMVGVGDVDGRQKSSSPPAKSAPTPPPKTTPPPAKTTPPPAPKYTAPPPVKSPTPTPPPHKEEAKSKYSAPPPPHKEEKKEESKSKYSSSPPVAGGPKVAPPLVGSERPKTGEISDKARANKENRSEKKYVETQKAVAAPKPKYTTPDGKEVAVRTATKDVEQIRNLPSSAIKPEVRQQNITVHVTKYNYPHPYTYYQTQPVVYVGGGYSSAFFWMMYDWDAERRARWLYHHRHEIDAAAYQRGVKDAETRAALERLERQRAYRDPNYTDPEFKSNPEAQYTDEYVEAAYNPPVHHEPAEAGDSGAGLTVLIWLGCIVLGGLIVWGGYVLFFKVRWGA